MLSISNRGKKMPPSPIRKLVPFAENAKKQGKKVYHLNIGQPDIYTPDLMLNAYKNQDAKVIEYGHSAGLESYRKKLVQYYKKYNINIDYEDIKSKILQYLFFDVFKHKRDVFSTPHFSELILKDDFESCFNDNCQSYFQ